jgi:hypothetical protein
MTKLWGGEEQGLIDDEIILIIPALSPLFHLIPEMRIALSGIQ